MAESKDIQYMGRVLQILNQAWVPHAGQQEAGQAVFNSNADLVFVECGRKFGKSEFAVYCCWMYALTRPGAEVYYLAPAVKQARELVWSNSRMQTCNTYKDTFIKQIEHLMGGTVKIQHNEMRITLPNGSFIKIDGSDNYNTQRGLKPDFITADEYRDFKKEWIEAVRPNMSVKKGKILFITTPPHGPNHAYEMAEECREGVATGDDHYFYLNLPSNCNDRIDGHTEWLEREHTRLLKQGRMNEWRREYMAEFISADEHAVIPQLNRDLIQPKEVLFQQISKEPGELHLYTALDPGNSSIFAGLTVIFNPHTCNIYVFDAFYEKNAQLTSIRHVWPVLKDRIRTITRETGRQVLNQGCYVNPRTPWLSRDLMEIYKQTSVSVPRTLKDPIFNISLLKDILSAGRMYVADSAKNLITEAELYQRSQSTFKIAGDQKQLINCLRYVLWACNYTVDMLALPTDKPEDEDFLDRLTGQISYGERMSELQADIHGILPDWDDLDVLEEETDIF